MIRSSWVGILGSNVAYIGLKVELVVLTEEPLVDPVAVVVVPAHEPVNLPPPKNFL